MSSIDGGSRGGVSVDGIMTSSHEFSPLDIFERSRADWNRESRAGCRWCVPVDHATI